MSSGRDLESEDTISKLFDTEEKSKRFKEELLSTVDETEQQNIVKFFQDKFQAELLVNTNPFYDLKRYNYFIKDKWKDIIQEKLDREFAGQQKHTPEYQSRLKKLKIYALNIDVAFAVMLNNQKKNFFSTMVSKTPLLKLPIEQQDGILNHDLFTYLTENATKVFDWQRQLMVPEIQPPEEISKKLTEFKKRNPKLIEAKKQNYAEELVKREADQNAINASIDAKIQDESSKKWIEQRAASLLDRENASIEIRARQQVNAAFSKQESKEDFSIRDKATKDQFIDQLAKRYYSEKERKLPKDYFEYHDDPNTRKLLAIQKQRHQNNPEALEKFIASMNMVFNRTELPNLKEQAQLDARKEAEVMINQSWESISKGMSSAHQSNLAASSNNFAKKQLQQNAQKRNQYDEMTTSAAESGRSVLRGKFLAQAEDEYREILRKEYTGAAISKLKSSDEVKTLLDAELMPRIEEKLREEKIEQIESDVAHAYIRQIEHLIKLIHWETGFLKTGFGGTKIKFDDGTVKKVPSNVAKIHAEYTAALKDQQWTKHFDEIVSIARNAAAKPGLFNTRRESTQKFYEEVAKIEPRGRSK